jgi:hypothetical protein
MHRIAIQLVRFSVSTAVVLTFAAHAAAEQRLHPSREDDAFQALAMGVTALLGVLGFGITMFVRTLRKRPAPPGVRAASGEVWNSAAAAPRADPFAAPPPASVPVASVAPDAAARVWARGKLLVLADGAVLPERCVFCDERSERTWKRTLYWHPAPFYFLLLLSPIVYAAITLVVRNGTHIEFPLCGAHARSRTRALAGSWVLGLGGFALLCASVSAEHAGMAITGACALLTGLVWGARSGQKLRAALIEDGRTEVKGAGAAFLRGLPDEAAANAALERVAA